MTVSASPFHPITKRACCVKPQRLQFVTLDHLCIFIFLNYLRLSGSHNFVSIYKALKYLSTLLSYFTNNLPHVFDQQFKPSINVREALETPPEKPEGWIYHVSET